MKLYTTQTFGWSILNDLYFQETFNTHFCIAAECIDHQIMKRWTLDTGAKSL